MMVRNSRYQSEDSLVMFIIWSFMGLVYTGVALGGDINFTTFKEHPYGLLFLFPPLIIETMEDLNLFK
jgi:hypothetical protein